jgi:hypothetical protein
MNHWHRFAVLTCLISLFSISVASAALDTPAVSTDVSGHAKQTLVVTAGPSGTPNGFTVRWMDQSVYVANGGQFPALPAPGEGKASFTGVPTLNTFDGQYTTFVLGPNQSIRIEIGDLADESGVAGTQAELEDGVHYYYAVFANDAIGNPDSDLSPAVNGETTQAVNCTFTQGYWKNHESAWPVSSLTLGSVTYTKAQLLSILGKSVQGNGLTSMAHQLIAAKLNIASGANPTAAAAPIAAADAQIGSLVCPPVGSGYLHPSTTSSTTQALDDFNNGVTGPGHCGTVATETKTWGQVKALFR